MILEENWELYHRRWSYEENRVDDHGDDKDGWIGAMGPLDGLWRRWPTATVVEDDPFRFFDDSSIWWSFSEFQSMESKKEWKWRKIGLFGTCFGEKLRKDGYVIISFDVQRFLGYG